MFGHVRGVLAFLLPSPSPSPRWGWPLAMGLEVSIRSPCRVWARALGAVGRGWHPAGLPWGLYVTWVGSSRGCSATGGYALSPVPCCSH